MAYARGGAGFAMVLLLALATGCGRRASEEARPVGLVGAGATFPAPLYERWLEEFRRSQQEIGVAYEAVGSGEGTRRFLAQEVDFGASDAALSDEEIALARRGAVLVPVTAGSLVLAYNLPGAPDGLRMPRAFYVDVFLGRGVRWNDPRIVEANPGVRLPDLPVQPVVRADGSGTTYALTNHLTAVSPAWRDGPGVGKEIAWPGTALEARGNAGVAGAIKQGEGTLGYVSYGVAVDARLPMARLENRAGNYVRPTAASGTQTLAALALDEHLRAFAPDPEGAESYPIVTLSWLLLRRSYGDAAQAEAVKRLVTWMLTDGQGFSEQVGYVPLAPRVASAGLAALENVGP